MAPADSRRLSSDIPGGVQQMSTDCIPERTGQVYPTLSYKTGENSASSFYEPWFAPSSDATARYPHCVVQSQAQHQQTLSSRAVYQSADEDIMNIHDEFAYTDDQAAQLTSCCVAHIFPCLRDYSSYFATNAQQPHVCGSSSSSPSHNHPKGFRYNVVTRSPTGGQQAGILTPYSSSVGIKCNENSNYYPGTSCQRDVFYQPLTQSHDFQNPQSEQLSGEYCQQLSQSLENNMVFSSLLDLYGVKDNTQHQEVWTPYIPSPAPVSVDFYQEDAVGFAEARDSSSVAINRPNNTWDNYTPSSSRRPSEVSTTSIQNESILIDKGPGKHCERSKSTAATNLTTSATRFCHGARNRRGNSGASTAGGVADYCQNKTCGVSLTHEKPYCQRYRLCKHCIGQLSLIVNGEAKRFCQQCSLLHPIGEFDTDKKSCRKKLAKHALRLRQRRAAKRLLNTNCA